MNLATLMISATLAMAAVPKAFAQAVFFTDRTAFETAAAATGGVAKVESFDNTPPAAALVDQIFFPDNQTPEFFFGVSDNIPGQTDPGLLDSTNADGLGLSSAITEGSGALTFFDIGIGGAFLFSNSIGAFGLDITTSAATSVTIIYGFGGNPNPTGTNTFTTNADTPQFVGVVDPAGFDGVVFDFGTAQTNVAYDFLSYRVALTATTTTLATVSTTTQTEGTSSTSTSEYIDIYVQIYGYFQWCSLYLMLMIFCYNNCTAIRVQPQQERPHPRLPRKPRLVQQLKRRAPPARVRVSIYVV